MKSKEKIYSIACILLIIDQVVKLLIKTNMHLFDEIKIIPNFFSLYYIENEGAAFSILGGARIILILVGVIALFILDRFINREKKISKLGVISLGMIIGGILGNMIDRILYGVVIDYLAFDLFNYSAPVFNIADIAITVGILLFIVDVFRSDLDGNKSRRRTKIKN